MNIARSIHRHSMRALSFALVATAAILLDSDLAWGQGESTLDTGDTAWILVSTAFVIMMTIPGLALFYGGLVRRTNVLSVLMQCLMCLAAISIVWVLIGYSLAFGPGGKWIGDLSMVGLAGVGMEPGEGETIPPLLFMMFQGTFAIITPALIVGAFAERIRFSAFLLFTVLWSVLIYSPLCHWVWGGGWLGDAGALDFAGGTVVHISSGLSALAAALLIGKRIGYGEETLAPHNLSFTVAGAALLWVGWFGFNAGSALGANGLAAMAFVTTNTAAAGGTLGWMFVEWMSRGKPTVLGAASGAVAGLVAITPAAGFVSPMSAIIIGLVAGGLCFFGIRIKEALKADDALDVVGIHGVGGIWGALATGIFADAAIGGTDGLLYGNPGQLWIQTEGVLATMVFCFVGSVILLKVVDAVVGLRVDDDSEMAGLDLSEHSERAYGSID